MGPFLSENLCPSQESQSICRRPSPISPESKLSRETAADLRQPYISPPNTSIIMLQPTVTKSNHDVIQFKLAKITPKPTAGGTICRILNV